MYNSTVKYKGLLIATFIFFLLVNTVYFWEAKLGGYAFFSFFGMILFFIVLAVLLARQILFAAKEKFNDRKRLFTIAIVSFVLLLAIIFPAGLINFDQLEGYDVLVAGREGSANCTTTLKLKENNTFIEKRICFGITEVHGNYQIKNDTIYFEAVKADRDGNEFYSFAVIEPSLFFPNQNRFDIVRYKSINDTTGDILLIAKNELQMHQNK